MQKVKEFGLLVILAAVLALPSAASATVVTSPAGSAYTGTIKAQSSNMKFHGAFLTVECASSTLEGKVESHGSSITATVKLFTLTFSSCNYPITVHVSGGLTFHCCWPPKIKWEAGARITIHTSVGECVFEPNNTELGSITTGSGAQFDIDSAAIPRTGGSFFCGSSGEWTGNYSVTSPGSLYID